MPVAAKPITLQPSTYLSIASHGPHPLEQSDRERIQAAQSPEYELAQMSPAKNLRGLSYSMDEFLQKWSVPLSQFSTKRDSSFVVDEKTSQAVKASLASTLGVPSEFSVRITCDNDGNALSSGQLSGFLTLPNQGGIPFSYTPASKSFLLGSSPMQQSNDVTESLERHLKIVTRKGTLEEVKNATLLMGQSTYFACNTARGEKVYVFENNYKLLDNLGQPTLDYENSLHVYVGRDKKMVPLQITTAARLRDGGTTYISAIGDNRKDRHIYIPSDAKRSETNFPTVDEKPVTEIKIR